MYPLEEWINSIATTSDEAAHMKAQSTMWYGIVDGSQLHTTTAQLRTGSELKWSTFTWCFYVVQPNLKIEEYRKLARVQNERSKVVNQCKCTIYESLKTLRMEHAALFAKALKTSRTEIRGVDVKQKNVARRFDSVEQGINATVI